MSMLQLNPTIPVLCKDHGYGDAFIISDVSIDVNPIYHVRFEGGIVKHFYSDDIRIVGNPMNGKGWDVKDFDTVNKIPAGARRNTDFIRYVVSITHPNFVEDCIYYLGYTEKEDGTRLLKHAVTKAGAKIFNYKGKAQVYKEKLTEWFPKFKFSVEPFTSSSVTN